MKPKYLHKDTLTDLWRRQVRWHLNRPTVDHSSGIACNLYDTHLSCDSMEFDFNLQEVWLNPGRWTMLVRDYMDPEATSEFVRKSRSILDGKGKSGTVTEMPFRRNRRTSAKHKWGNCLLGAVFRGYSGGHIPPTLSFYSRVSYNGYIAGLDLGLAHVLGREISEGHPSEIGFQWHLNTLSLHPFKVLPYIYGQPDLVAEMSELDTARTVPPTWQQVKKWQVKIEKMHQDGKPLDEERYGAFKRIRRRYEESLSGLLVPDTHIENLDFSKVEGYSV